MSESLRERRRRKFAAGVLDQLAGVLGGVGGAVAAAGSVAPVVATAVGTLKVDVVSLAVVSGSGLAGACALAAAALWCKGRAKQIDDDQLANMRTGTGASSSPTLPSDEESRP